LKDLFDFEQEWEADKHEAVEDSTGVFCGKYQRQIWDILDKPNTSSGARVRGEMFVLT
jgi:hypothetical protein